MSTNDSIGSSLVVINLRGEDGYKVRKLSDTKIQIEHKVPIFGTQLGSIRVVDTLTLKVRYKISPNEVRHSHQMPTYYLIPIKDRFIQTISQNWKIKKKCISLQKKIGTHLIDGYMVNGIYCGIIFDDNAWTRDYILNNILDEKGDDTSPH